MNMTYGYASVFFSVIIGLSLFNLAHSKIIQFVLFFSLITHRFLYWFKFVVLVVIDVFHWLDWFFYVFFSCYCRLHYVLFFFCIELAIFIDQVRHLFRWYGGRSLFRDLVFPLRTLPFGSCALVQVVNVAVDSSAPYANSSWIARVHRELVHLCLDSWVRLQSQHRDQNVFVCVTVNRSTHSSIQMNWWLHRHRYPLRLRLTLEPVTTTTKTTTNKMHAQ